AHRLPHRQARPDHQALPGRVRPGRVPRRRREGAGRRLGPVPCKRSAGPPSPATVRPSMPQKINFKLLSAFISVAEHASFRKAAEQNFVSLPAISMQIKQLEAQVGVALFQRTTRRVELTPEGEQLLISTRKAMAELDSGLSLSQQAANAQHGTLALACVPP